jgi:hypothetical protein
LSTFLIGLNLFGKYEKSSLGHFIYGSYQ